MINHHIHFDCLKILIQGLVVVSTRQEHAGHANTSPQLALNDPQTDKHRYIIKAMLSRVGIPDVFGRYQNLSFSFNAYI